MFAPSHSSPSTPRSGPSDGASMPSFVVTSSNDAVYSAPSATTPVKSTQHVTLNPEAREFRFSPNFGGALFAMPASAASAPTASAAAPQPRWSAQSGSPHASPPPPPSSSAAAELLLDSPRLMALTEAYMHELYDRRCQEEGVHMVSVFHLHPRTTHKQLSSMFFPTGASAAEVLEPRLMPEPLASAFTAVRQRAGVVFFTRKDFAMVGVEKIHDFVPHGQHQPLVVRYCGPDATASPLPGRSQGSGGDKAAGAATVPSPPSSRPMPSQSNFRDPHSTRDLFPAAAVPSSSSPSATAAAAGLPAVPHFDRLANGDAAATLSSTYDVIDQHFLQKYAGDNVFLVGVHNLAYGTSPKSFYKMFYPMGALDSELLPRPVSVDGKLRCSGVAIFGSKGMAVEAAEKINDFVPHGQRRPVVARYLDRTPSPRADVTASTAAAAAAAAAGGGAGRRDVQRASPVASASTPRAHAANTTTNATTGAAAAAGMSVPASSSAALLLAIERQLRAKAVSDTQLASDMAALVLCNDSGEAEAKKLADILRDVLQSMGDHSTILSSPLSGALREVHHTLGIRPRTAPPSPADGSTVVKKAVMFLQLVGRTFMMLVADTAAPRQTRMVAAVQCAYLYQYTYLPKTPLSFATVLFQNCSRELREAKEFVCREADLPSSVSEERQHRPWITLMDALHEMVQVWRTLDPRTYAIDPARDDYERFVRDFRGMEPAVVGGSPLRDATHSSALTAAVEAGTGACTPRNDALEVTTDLGTSGSGSGSGNGPSTSSAKKSQLVTPSARPTPRRVVSKSYSTTTSDWKAKQTTPLATAAGAVPPQVMLASHASDYTQGASEFSAESGGAAGAFGSALRSAGVTPQHPSMRFAWGSRVAGTTAAPLSPTSAAAATATPTLVVSPASVLAASERSDAAMTECTVYITKLPSCFTSAQVRRLLLHFGDYRKVRLCHDDKETTRGCSAEALAAHQLKFHDLCFGFVEFVEPGSARAMVEFFRNEVHTAGAFDFLRAPVDGANFDDNDLAMLRSTRTSQARNPIHDQQLVDASRGQPCLFGIVRPELTVETYADVVTADDVAAALAEKPSAPPLPATFTTAPVGGAAAAAAAEHRADDDDDGAAATAAALFGGVAPQPLEDVHFPQNFPYHYVFANACDGGSGGVLGRGYDDDDDAPVLVEDDDYEGMQEYDVQQILEMLN